MTIAIVLVLAGAAAYEAAVALQWIGVGNEPGQGARYEGLVTVSATVALVAGIVVSVALVARPRRAGAARLFGVASAALVVAHYYTFDTYYLPTLTRYSDSGSFSPAWVYSVAIAAALASLLAVARPTAGLVATALVIRSACSRSSSPASESSSAEKVSSSPEKRSELPTMCCRALARNDVAEGGLDGPTADLRGFGFHARAPDQHAGVERERCACS